MARSQSARPAKGHKPSYMQSKKKAGERWASILSDDEAKEARSNLLNSRQWADLLHKLEEEPVREAARVSQRRAAAQAAVSPKPTHVPKPANWRKRGYTADLNAPTQAHEVFCGNSPQQKKMPPPKQAYGSARPMSTKGRQFQLEKQRQMQELRRIAELRAQYKEDLAFANYEHRQHVIQYMRTPATELRTTEVDRVRAREKVKKDREEEEARRSRGRSMDTRHIVAQNAAEERARAEARAKAEAIAAKRAAAASTRGREPASIPSPPGPLSAAMPRVDPIMRGTGLPSDPLLHQKPAYLAPSYVGTVVSSPPPPPPISELTEAAGAADDSAAAASEGTSPSTQEKTRYVAHRLRREGLSPEPPTFRPDLALRRTEELLGKTLLEREFANSELIQRLQRQAMENRDDDSDSVWSAIEEHEAHGEATGASAKPVHQTRLRAAFDAFDANGSGAIDKDEMRAILREFRIEKPADELDELFRQADLDGNGVIDYDEFVALFSKQSAGGGLGAVFAERGLIGLIRGW